MRDERHKQVCGCWGGSDSEAVDGVVHQLFSLHNHCELDIFYNKVRGDDDDGDDDGDDDDDGEDHDDDGGGGGGGGGDRNGGDMMMEMMMMEIVMEVI